MKCFSIVCCLLLALSLGIPESQAYYPYYSSYSMYSPYSSMYSPYSMYGGMGGMGMGGMYGQCSFIAINGKSGFN
jgi:hypothetical protein